MRLQAICLALLAGPGTSASDSFLPFARNADLPGTARPSPSLLTDMYNALSVMQDAYFDKLQGTWPDAIDWTAAMLNTHLAGALNTFTRALSSDAFAGAETAPVEKENLLTTYFSQLLASFYGQNAVGLRTQAYDDMLWVVLGWIEAIKYVNLHSLLHYSSGEHRFGQVGDILEVLANQTWHGNTWVPIFSHRARIFWDIASQGWDRALCGGGMVWNPRLTPYKNAITNELFISASANMYLHFPGDGNDEPFLSSENKTRKPFPTGPTGARDPKFLAAAIEAYQWLRTSGMMNSKGLYIDGFHISGWPRPGHTTCDQRDEMVYTYNQGVVLTGQRGLWQTTGEEFFLREGHELIQSVISATGWDLEEDRVADDLSVLKPGRLPRWHGLGRAGVLEEICDSYGTCSQNAHTFKGIFFHHLATFCAPLYDPEQDAQKQSPGEVQKALASHKEACTAYSGWLKHNAAAALATRDADGKFGTWWTAGLLNITVGFSREGDKTPQHNQLGVDYRNYGVPDDPVWVGLGINPPKRHQRRFGTGSEEQAPMGGPGPRPSAAGGEAEGAASREHALHPAGSDPNDRGRGRTVETQGGGLAVLRALWEVASPADSPRMAAAAPRSLLQRLVAYLLGRFWVSWRL